MSDYPRCETCKHWDTEDKWGEGTHLEEPYGQCKAYIPEIDEGGNGYLHTKPEFGCIRHSSLRDTD